MSVEREERADEEQLLEGSAAWARGLPPRPGEDGRGDGVPLRHLAVPGSWWEGNQEGKYKGHLLINWLLTLRVTLLNEIVS